MRRATSCAGRSNPTCKSTGAKFYNVRMNARREFASPLTRRQWTALVVAAAPLAAQVTTTTPPSGSPAPAQAPATPEERLQKAYAEIHKTSGMLFKIEVPMTLEPAFAFRALG